MMGDLGHQDVLYKPTAYWMKYVNRIMKGFNRYGINSFRAHYEIGKGYADVLPFEAYEMTNNQFLRYFLITFNLLPFNEVLRRWKMIRDCHMNQAKRAKENFFRVVLKEMEKGILAKKSLPYTLLAEPQDVVDIKGQRYSTLYLELAHRIQVASRHIPLHEVHSIVEIGGGFGTNVHLLLHLYPNIRKVLIVDIPPILYVETEYLRAFYGEAVKDYLITRYKKRMKFASDKSLEIFLVPPWQLKLFDNNNICLFWNAASFQEMERDVVYNYVAKLAKMNPKHLYLYTLKHGLIKNLVGQNAPIDKIFLKESFLKICSLYEVEDELNPYWGVCVHLLGQNFKRNFDVK